MPLEHPLVREAVHTLAEEGVPVVTLVSDLSNSRRAGYVGLDNRAAGRTAALLLGLLMLALGWVVKRAWMRVPLGAAAAVLLVGAGGAGSAIAHALVMAGVRELAIHDEDRTRRQTLVQRLAGLNRCPVIDGSADPTGFDLVLNATPVGMKAGDPYPLDVERMNKACQALIGTQDFSSFQKVGSDVKTSLCDVREAYWEETPGGYLFHIKADRFLRNMVRAIVGTFVRIGKGQQPPTHMAEVIDDGDAQVVDVFILG